MDRKETEMNIPMGSARELIVSLTAENARLRSALDARRIRYICPHSDICTQRCNNAWNGCGGPRPFCAKFTW